MHGFGMVLAPQPPRAAGGPLRTQRPVPGVLLGRSASLLFVAAALVPALEAVWWVGVGVTAYGACYLFVHEVYIHHRLPIRRAAVVATWSGCVTSHRVHHHSGGEPYGMLLPFVPPVAASRRRAERSVARPSGHAAVPTGASTRGRRAVRL